MGKKHSIEEMKGIAVSRGGKCLSNEYKNSKTHLNWECANGHSWMAIPEVIIKGHWCPHCYKNAPLTIEKMMEIAKSRGGECISTSYSNLKTKLKWRCSKGHIWIAKPSDVKYGTWCPICANQMKHTISEMKEIAKSHGGKCLSREYFNLKTKLEWECIKGHKWKAISGSIIRGSWCPHCVKVAKLTILEMKNIAKSRNGKCLSKNYINNRSKLNWKCQNGHEWDATPDSIKSGSWCPICSSRKGKQLIRGSIKEMQKIAISRGGICLSNEYINDRIKITWKCSMGHTWKARPNDIKQGRWCPYCAKRMRLTISEMRDIAISRGGSCISTRYKNNRTNLKWKCINGHEWEATATNISKGTWCPYCANRVPLTLDEMKDIAHSRGGECLSKHYDNIDTKLLWMCSEGHEWEATPYHIKCRRSWCPTCANRIPLKIQDMHALASTKGGKCLSKTYINNQEKLTWQCKNGHTWKASPNNVYQGTWCPACAGSIILTIGSMQEHAKSLGGYCLSNEYINSHEKLQWQCAEGHQWEARPMNIRRGTWCPFCSQSTKEMICRNIIENLTGFKFVKIRPQWLTNPETGSSLELDGYCDELKIGFEYQGRQHYEYIEYFHQTKSDFKYRMKLDRMKRKLCDKEGIQLIEIPYFIKIENLPDYIRNSLTS